MLRKTLLLSCSLTAMLLLCFCTDSNREQPAEDAEEALLPLAIGNMWVYEHTATGDDGKVISTWRDTMRVVGTEEIKGNKWYQVKGFMVQDTILLASREDGLWMLNQDQQEIHYFNSKLDVGKTYTRPPSFNVELRNAAADISVPAGKFSCIHFSERFDNAPSASSYYLAPGTGLVEWSSEKVLVQNAAEGAVYQKLVEYKLQ